MVLSAFVISQLVFDVALLVLFILSAIRAKPQPARPARPPDWYQELVPLIQELLLITEPILDALETQALPAGDTRPRPSVRPEATRDTPSAPRHQEALELLRAGVALEEVQRRGKFLPGELRVMANLVAAEAAPGAPAVG